MKQQLPIWFKVLSHFEKKNYFHNGLTIPFLIGCNSFINPSSKALTISELLNEFQYIHEPEIITILECGNIGEYVIGILDYETKKYYAKYNRIIHKRFKNILILDSSFNKYQDIDQVTKIMEKKYQTIINEQKYSKNNGVWTIFTEIDKKRLNELK